VEGEIWFEGKDLLKLSNEEIRQVRGNRIAMIFQEPMTSLNPVLTVGRQLAEPLEVHRNLPLKEALEKAKDLLGQVQIADGDKRIHDYPHQFSGGMRQRAMIAMGIGCGPKLIIADEPTTALDVTVQAQLLELLKDLTRRHGLSLIIITHNLGVVARYADRVNVMYAGKIVEKGTAFDIYEDPRHPYTIGLMHSVPLLDQDIKKKLVPIPGQPPNLANIPRGCAFHPRCPYAIDRCRRKHRSWSRSAETMRKRVGFMSKGNADILVRSARSEGPFPISRAPFIKKKIGDIKAVDGVSFRIQRGETLGLVGESGSGKTTTGNGPIAIGTPHRRPDLLRRRGHHRPSQERPFGLRRRMQIIFQDPFSSLDPRMTGGRHHRRTVDHPRPGRKPIRVREQTAELLPWWAWPAPWGPISPRIQRRSTAADRGGPGLGGATRFYRLR
jgi:peptide/nickel transport system ATP-binding protein